MSITITALPTLGSITDATYIPTETSAVTGKITALSLRNYVAAGTLSAVTATTGTFTTLSATTLTTTTLTVTGDEGANGNLTVTGNLTVSGNIAGNLSTGAQPYITTLGNITTGNISVTNLSVSGVTTHTGITTVAAAIVPTSNAAAVNLGSTSTWFNNIYGTAVHALYADLAERYTSDTQYDPGTVVVFGVNTEVTASYQPNDTRVAGVVSTNPAYTMNAGITGVDVALQGRVPCRVTGPVTRGDLMVSSAIPGVAMANNTPPMGSVIGKALGNHNGSGVGVIEVVVGRL